MSLFTALVTIGIARAQPPPEGSRTPVVLELFTSESCSSCPPADRLLESLDRQQPFSNVELIVLSEHVDYWNETGWTDPYSSKVFTIRQQHYAQRFGLESVYTPELVVDGRREGIGSNAMEARMNIKQSAIAKKVSVTLRAVERSQSGLRLHVSTGALEDGAGPATLFVAVALDKTKSDVRRGENAGCALTHVAVVKTLIPIASIKASRNFSGDVDVPLPSNIRVEANGIRLVAFLQIDKSLKIAGAAQTKL